MNSYSISIIIPVLNEAKNIGVLVTHLFAHKEVFLKEIIVVDGGSTDQTVSIAQAAGAQVLTCSPCGRAPQMNKGVAAANGDFFYFVHGDTIPPPSYLQDLQIAIAKGHQIGCFRAKYPSKNPLLKINSYCTRFNKLWCRGGDQTLFISRSLFDELGGYRADCIIMEEYELIQKAQKKHTFHIIPKEVITSTRKYEKNSYLRIQLASLVAFIMFRRGIAQEKLAATYKRLIG